MIVSFQRTINNTPQEHYKPNIFNPVFRGLPKTALPIRRTSRSLPKLFEDLYKGIQQQLDITETKEIQKAVLKVKKELPQFEKAQIIQTMQKLTQFASFNNIKKIPHKMAENGVYSIRNIENHLSLNDCFDYILSKKAELLNHSKKNGLSGVFLDEYTLKYLENLKKNDPTIFEEYKNNNNIFFILDGWENGINIYNNHENLTQKTIEILKKISPDGTDFLTLLEKELNSKTVEKAKNLGFNPIIIKNESNTKTLSAKHIKKQLEPINIPKRVMKVLLDLICKEKRTIFDKKYRLLINKFLEKEFTVFSPKRISNALKQKHEKIIKEVTRQKKPIENIYYFIPNQGKSFAQTTYHYAQVNNINPEKFIYSGTETEFFSKKMPQNTTLVILDDIVDSAESMTEDDFYYKEFCKFKDNKDISIFFAPITCSKKGIKIVKSKIKELGRNGRDKLIIDRSMINTPMKDSLFYKKTNFENKIILQAIMNGSSYSGSELAVAFPYMSPDNNAAIGSALGQFFLINKNAVKGAMGSFMNPIKNKLLFSSKIPEEIKDRIL